MANALAVFSVDASNVPVVIGRRVISTAPQWAKAHAGTRGQWVVPAIVRTGTAERMLLIVAPVRGERLREVDSAAFGGTNTKHQRTRGAAASSTPPRTA